MAGGQTIIIKKHDDDHHDDHHGGGWKVAYADFMTAMMAFFLLLWIIAATDEEKLEGLAEYFTPSLSPLQGGGSQGMLQGQLVELDGQMSASEGLPPQPDMPDFGAADPLAAFDSRMRDQPPEVVVEYLPAEDAPPSPEQIEAERMAQAAAELQARRVERDADLDRIEAEIEAKIAATPELAGISDNLRFDRTAEGLLMQILDEEERPMFDTGSARIVPHTQALIEIVGEALREMPQDLAISGHTDSLRFARQDGYGNWELSSDRANATRRALVAAGISPDRMARVSGLADTVPLYPDRPEAPQNRRIGVLLQYPEPSMTEPARP
ncbi:flagellar motor protein MotB [Limimaricola pyoseonensis]|uniref:Chemotaxis protein MotB n=1 Tax=Limimaricola pyoseonensis TaxID=521013 RepID=A0A1G7KAM4_9RHOB|nr:flagellar motor protein MotB [Limimaricola pyoseonensis]SDF34090.1 chemotaxis protein MotB [Limimaricola pyoseonensis]